MVGTDIRTLAHVLGVEQADDRTLAALKHIALAHAHIQALQDEGIDTSLAGKLSILPGLKRVYREILHLRKELPDEYLNWEFLSRFGRLVKHETQVPDLTER